MKRKIILTLLSAATVLMVNSCAPSTPTSRIELNPAMFESLPSSQRELVSQGQIKKGMHRDGVLLAWGKPNGSTAGSRNGKSFEKWVYTTASPVYTSTFNTYGGRFGRFGRFGGFGCHGYGFDDGFGMGHAVHYIQQTAASVEFDQNNKVTDWETRR